MYPNSYSICVFACCRELYDVKTMDGQCFPETEGRRRLGEGEDSDDNVGALYDSCDDEFHTEAE